MKYFIGIKYLLCLFLSLVTTLIINITVYFLEDGYLASITEISLTIVVLMFAFLLLEKDN